MQTLVAILKDKKTLMLLGCIVLFFVIIRIPSLSLEYHQDEWKNVHVAESAESAGNFFSHPPLMQIFFRTGYALFGQEHFRLFPFLFSLASLPILFLVVKRRGGERAAFWSLCLFSVCFYNILGSSMADVDGSVLPFFFLLSVYAYDRWGGTDGKEKTKWLILLFLFATLGFLVKLSFIIAVGALFLDFIWKNFRSIDLRKFVRGSISVIVFCVLYIGILFLFELLYPAFNIRFMLGHATSYDSSGGNNALQILVQAIKAIFYLSPLLLFPLVFLTRPVFEKTRVFFAYLFCISIFYFVLFDFSGGALDKYLMVLIVPLSVVSGVILSRLTEGVDLNNKKTWFLSSFFGLLLLGLNFLPHSVVALYPKTEWFGRVLHLHWNVLNPFNGGSGPLGFYVSFLFIALCFLSCFALCVVGVFKKTALKSILPVFLCVCFFYNILFFAELSFGGINGSAYSLVDQSVKYLVETGTTAKVLTYNDIGAHELSKHDLYGGRFYAAPQYEDGHKKLFADFQGLYLVVDVPRIYQDSFYNKFFSYCKSVFTAKSGQMQANIYNCENGAKIVSNISNE